MFSHRYRITVYSSSQGGFPSKGEVLLLVFAGSSAILLSKFESSVFPTLPKKGIGFQTEKGLIQTHSWELDAGRSGRGISKQRSTQRIGIPPTSSTFSFSEIGVPPGKFPPIDGREGNVSFSKEKISENNKTYYWVKRRRGRATVHGKKPSIRSSLIFPGRSRQTLTGPARYFSFLSSRRG